MSKFYLRLPNGKTIEFHDKIINTITCMFAFVDTDLTTIQDFFGEQIIDYVDVLNENNEIINNEKIYAKYSKAIISKKTIKEPIQRLVKDAYEEVIPAVVDPETSEIITPEQVINHDAVYETIYVDKEVQVTEVYLDKPSAESEIENIKSVVGIVNTNNMSVAEFKNYYKTLIGNECTKAIEAGLDVDTSLGTKHFSYTIEDQSNIKDLYNLITSSEELLDLPYHADSEYCTIFKGSDIVNAYLSLSSNKLYHTTYCNILNRMIDSKKSINTIKEITYGMDITSESDKQILDNVVACGKAAVDKVIAKFSTTETTAA